MAQKRKLAYRYKFFKGKLKTALPLNKFRYATSFEIWYGKRRVVSRTAFSPRVSKVAARRKFLENLVYKIERHRLHILKKRRDEARKKREALRAKKVKKIIRRRLLKPIKRRVLSADEEVIHEQTTMAIVGLPVFPKVYEVEPLIAKAAYIHDTLIIPIAPESPAYSKRIVDKTMRKDAWGWYHLAILDFTFAEEEYIPVTADNFSESYRRAYNMMLPHVHMYFNDVKNSSEHFIFRIKFLNRWDEDNAFDDYGISYNRTEIRDWKQMENLFDETFRRLFGDAADPLTTKGKLRRNYLEGEKTIYVKGFTLEASKIP